jgi:trehalose synthase
MSDLADTSDLWWKKAVVYCVDVETYQDSDGDGIGDLRGLTDRVDYLAELGITCLWLMPFYPTPDRDDGYDVTDLFGVDSRLGTMGDLVELVRTAHDRGIKVIADLVVNHTSDRHPWFKAARRSRSNPYRDYYVWRSDPPPDTSDKVVFPDKEDTIWTKDQASGEWYLHHFYSHQPDLNYANPAVREEIARSIGLWLQVGLDGFRVDAVPFLVEDIDTQADHVPGDPHAYLKDLRAFLGRRRGDAVLLGEVNLPRAEQRRYFGGGTGDELQMMFDFITMQATYLSLARADARPLAKALRGRPRTHATCQWATFVRNHDELTLDKLDDSQREEVFAAFGPEPDMQLFGRGLRRRLPPMVDGDPRRLRMIYSLLFSLPGTPTLYYGEEIGMGEDLEVPGRMAVRPPMQWTPGPTGGFSTAAPRRLVQRVVPGGYGPDHVNVRDQRRDPDSLWRFMQRLVQTYRECPELGWGEFAELPQPERSVLVHSCTWQGSTVVVAHNLAPQPVSVDVRVPLDGDQPHVLEDVHSGDAEALDRRATARVDLEAYGHRWWRLRNLAADP